VRRKNSEVRIQNPERVERSVVIKLGILDSEF